MASYQILVVDNFDSFVYNIVQYLEELGAHCSVMKNDEIVLKSIATYDGVLISPGPGAPESAGASIEVILECARLEKPMLGVCLGVQTLAVAFGGRVDQAPELIHGRTSEIFHEESRLFLEEILLLFFHASLYFFFAVKQAAAPIQSLHKLRRRLCCLGIQKVIQSTRVTLKLLGDGSNPVQNTVAHMVITASECR